MTPDDVRYALGEIELVKGDAEVAHSAEDGLWLDVLGAIAAGCVLDNHTRECARLAITSRNISFERWYA